MRRSILLLSLTFLLASCGGASSSSSSSSSSAIEPSTQPSSSPTSEPSSSSSSATSSSSAPSYVDAEIDVHYTKKENDTKAKIRYYEGGHVPYISLKDYVGFLYRGRNIQEGRDKVEMKKDGSVYEFTVAGGATASFDIDKNTLYSPNLPQFKNTSFFETGEKSLVSFDGLPFVRIASVEKDKDPNPTTINFSSYNMKIYGDDTSLYVPLSFASDLFTCDNMLRGAYNTKALYVFCESENESFSAFGADYYEAMFSSPIEEDYAKFFYDELCLDYDILLGRPGRSALEKHFDLSKGLNAALEEKELGKLIKSSLTSTSVEDYALGVELLGALRDDGGHSLYSPFTNTYVDASTGERKKATWLEKIESSVLERFDEAKAKYVELQDPQPEYAHMYASFMRQKMLEDPIDGPLYGERTYRSKGDLAFISIDNFSGDVHNYKEWNAYYEGKGELPYGEDKGGAVISLYKGLEKASKDTNIKNIVIDMSVNTGGSSDEMLYVFSLLSGHSELHFSNRVSGQTFTAHFDVDRNLDTKFDEKDQEVDFLKGKNLAILMSHNGFSCGGIAPIYLHDYGVFTMGDDSGGGSCSVYLQSDAHGTTNRSSSPSQILTPKDKKSIDASRVGSCDHALPIKKTEGGYDYSAFYDLDSLSAIMNEHFKAA